MQSHNIDVVYFGVSGRGANGISILLFCIESGLGYNSSSARESRKDLGRQSGHPWHLLWQTKGSLGRWEPQAPGEEGKLGRAGRGSLFVFDIRQSRPAVLGLPERFEAGYLPLGRRSGRGSEPPPAPQVPSPPLLDPQAQGAEKASGCAGSSGYWVAPSA